MSINLNNCIVTENTTIVETMKVINRCETSVAFICENGILKAAVSDGDIRRYIISGGNIEKSISDIANYSPVYVTMGEDIDYIAFMKEKHIKALPIVNEAMKIIDIKFLSNPVFEKSEIGIPVVIMAGGKGTRLKPYTDILPKPLIPVGDKTITEHIISHFSAYSCTHFDMIVNYKKNFIKSYFQDHEIKYDIDFVEEPEFWGTAGGLKLVEGRYNGTFFVTNCDILIEADYKPIYDYHKESGNLLTLVCARKKVVVPYGTIETDDDGQILSLMEKPSFEFKTSTGLYLMEPEFLSMIPPHTRIDITDIISKCINEGKKVGSYLIEADDWLDMGQLEEMERMKKHLGVK